MTCASAVAQNYSLPLVDSLVYERMKNEPQTDDFDVMFDKEFCVIKDVHDLLYEQYVTNIMMNNFFRYPICHDVKSYVDIYMKHVKTDSLRQKVQTAYEKFCKDYSPIFPGHQAPDFTFKDAKGKEHKLSDLRGKMLFIDIWGTWCAPCKEEMPLIAKLYEKYKNDKRVKIISIACDKKFDVWKKYITEHSEPWTQYIITPEGDKILDGVYHVFGIPRFMLIDKNGIIINADSSRPSFGEAFEKEFEKAINQ